MTSQSEVEQDFSATVDRESLVRLLGTLALVVDEARIHFTASQMYARAVDPVNVIAVDTGRVSADSSQSMEIGLPTHEALTAVKSFPADCDDVTIGISEDGENILFQNELWFEQVRYFDPDSIRKDPDIDGILSNVEFAVSGEVEAWKLLGSLYKILLAAENAVRVFPGPGEIGLEGDNSYIEDGELIHEWKYYETVETGFDVEAGDDVESMFSSDVLKDFVESVPDDGTVRLALGDRMPLMAESSEGSTSLIAPRITDPTGESDG